MKNKYVILCGRQSEVANLTIHPTQAKAAKLARKFKSRSHGIYRIAKVEVMETI